MAHNNSSKLLKKRYKADRRFKLYSMIAPFIALSFLVVLISGIVFKGYKAFLIDEIALTFEMPELHKNNLGLSSQHLSWNYDKTIKKALYLTFGTLSEEDYTILKQLIDPAARKIIYQAFLQKPSHQQSAILWLPASSYFMTLHETEADKKSLQNNESLPLYWLKKIKAEKRHRTVFNTDFFKAGDSRNAKTAGIWGALVGSFYLMVVTLFSAFPIGVATAIYLEEFSPKNKLTHFIEVNISNLAAVPSIVFGLLGLAIFLNFLHLPRSSTLVGGMTLCLMTLPSIIVVSRTSLRSVPKTIREAALGLGASSMQVMFHHVLPSALPGIITGTIIGMARALGETAPLLMIGMMAFIVTPPKTLLDPSSALPVQIFTWAKNPEPSFLINAAAAIIVLLLFLIVMNLIAILLRKHFDQRK
jgi:phosphate transport system permease protein